MKGNGEVTLTATTVIEPVSTKILAIISEDIQDDCLISCKDLEQLERIPKGFPNVQVPRSMTTRDKNIVTTSTRRQTNNQCRSVQDNLTDRIFQDYKDVMSDELNPVPMQTGKKMHINMTENPRPFKTLIARRVPLRFEEEANKTIQDLINKGVITPVTDTTDWCSPAFFLAKADGVRVRLVTDYTKLNKFVKRPVHPFPATRDIIQSVPKGQRVFAKLDAVHGYFQLALDEESSFLTTFLLPQGKFRYLRAPMGLNASSNEWCCHSDKIILGLPWARKIVDDTLIWAEDINTLEQRLRTVLDNIT